ncbi:MAG: DNA-directed RNA polymerase subunit beta [Firmicutes bacterium]|nr:DNA-directed RNA polymerase subunit beta [Bacillota bacterium]
MSVNATKIKSGRRERVSFIRQKDAVALPYLIEIQKNSFNKFIKHDIMNVLREFSPIADSANKAEIEFLDCWLEGEPKYSERECEIRKQTRSLPLKVKTRLTIKESGQVIESDIFLGDIPVMNDSGSFLINGVKRVVKNQIVRSPGVYYSGVLDKTGKTLFSNRIMPQRGEWIELEQTVSDVLRVVVARASKMSVGILIKALALSEDEHNEEMLSDDAILKLFNNHDVIKATLDKEPQKNYTEVMLELARKMRPGDIPSISAARRYIKELFFLQARYDLREYGRFKINQKLGLASRIRGQITTRDIVSPDGEVLLKKDEEISRDKATEIQNTGVNEVYISLPGDKEYKVIGNARVCIFEYTGFAEKDLPGFAKNLYVHYPLLKKLMTENKSKEKRVKAIIENRDDLIGYVLTLDDLVASIGYLLDLNEGMGRVDEIDHLGNRRIRPVGETLEAAFRGGIIKLRQSVQEKLQIANLSEVTPASVVSSRPINVAIKDFVSSGQLSQNMDDVNPLSAFAEKRKITSDGPGGLSKERAGAEVRDIHYTQYGRICPIETPEGESIGITLNLASHAKVNEFGFLITPYLRVDKEKGVVTNEIVYLSADEEDGACIAQACEPLDKERKFVSNRIVVRKNAEVIYVNASQVDYLDVSLKQFMSTSAALVPFIENDDATRALMAANMQRQGLPLIKTEAPLVSTGMEAIIVRDGGDLTISKSDGVVTYASADRIVVKTTDNKLEEHILTKFEKTYKKTCKNSRTLVVKGEKVKAGDILADGYACSEGELSVGKNILIAYMNWEGYNFEDAIIINERIVKEDVFTSIYLMEASTKATTTKLGDEEITRDIPSVGESALKDLDENGIIRIGAYVEPGDILVGKVTPKGETELNPEERLLRAIFGEKSREVKDTSLRVENGEGGVVVDVKILSRKNKDELDNGVNTQVKVFVAQKRKISVGDKMAGRHGNKGIVAKVMPAADMPFMANGQPIDMLLNPLGVPSRMNVGQVLETHMGLIAKTLGIHVETPCFNGANEQIIQNMFKENGLPLNGKMRLYDGRTGEPFLNDTTVGYKYMLKLDHMVDSKVNARSIGPYTMVTRQPLGGRSQNGGQKLGEMEVWALEAYGASALLQEMLTVKSDDIAGRFKMYDSIVHGTPLGEPSIPEGFRVLVKEFQALALDVDVLTEEGKEVNVEELAAMETEETPFQDTVIEVVDVLDQAEDNMMSNLLGDLAKMDDTSVDTDDLFD